LYSPKLALNWLQVKQPLNAQQFAVLNELIQLAGGVGIMKEKAFMNPHQSDMLPALKTLGYVATTGLKFVVLLVPDARACEESEQHK
jgi:hypothetical protein